MADRWRQTFRMHRGYWPSQAYTGGANETIFRGRNVVFQGGPETVYAEVFPGHELIYTITDPSAVETDIPLECVNGDTLVRTNALIQFLILPGHQIVIPDSPPVGVPPYPPTPSRQYIITALEATGFATAAGEARFRISPPFQGATGTYNLFTLPSVIHTVNQVLALTRGGGSIQGLPKGHYLVVGTTQFFSTSNIAVRLLPGKYGGGLAEGTFATYAPPTGAPGQDPGSLYFEDAASLSPTTLSVAHRVGFSTPTIVSITEPSYLGSKNMPPGTYSLRIARGRQETGGHGPLSEAKQIVITKEGGKMQVTFPDAAPGQTSWQVFGSLFSVAEGVTGPWYQITEITEKAVADAGRIVDFEYRDYEIAGRSLASFDNDPPPRASFLSIFGGVPVLIGAYGTKPTDFGPVPAGGEYPGGPVLQPGKFINPEGFPPDGGVPIGQPEPIVGYVEAEGRLYIMAKNNLHVAVLTGNVDAPIAIRPFAQSAFARQGNLLYVEGTLYGFTRNGPVRFSTAGELGVEDKSFAAIVATDTVDWVSERVCIGYDPASQSVVYFHANEAMGTSGKWQSVALAYHTKLGVWSTPIGIEDPTRDMLVSSCTTLGGRLHFVAAERIYVWGTGTGSIEWFVLTPFVDQGAEGLDKSIRGLALTYSCTANAKAMIFGTSSDSLIDEPSASHPLNATAAAASQSGEITLTPAPAPNMKSKVSKYFKLNVARKRLYAIRVGATYTPGANTMPDRVDEIIIEGFTHIPHY